MKRTTLINRMPFDNILYIGDEWRVCLAVIEEFNNCLTQIERAYSGWFNHRTPKNRPAEHDKLQYHIHYHFEGGIAVFKFRDEDELPEVIRNECLIACSNIVAEQVYSVA
jgi:hypothetical protein